MAGRWVDDSGGNFSEETWGPPSGDCIVGMWRWVVGGKAKLYELLLIRAETDGLTLRLRHFDRMSVGWEDKERPISLRLVKLGAGEAAFEGPGRREGETVRITYSSRGADVLVSVLEKTLPGQPPSRTDFSFKRKPSRP